SPRAVEQAYPGGMRVLILDAPQAMLDERRRLGLDGRDEVWDGVVHVVPPPKEAHQRLSLAFYDVVGTRARGLGLVPRLETGLFDSDRNFRVPDHLYRRPEQESERGAEGAELVVEIRSPRDETYDKLAFYAERGVREVLVLHPEPCAVELFVNVGGAMQPVPVDAAGAVHCAVLDLSIAAVDAILRITWPGHSTDI
ncbi:MAG: Uma2 family endonuclease, partial [Sporichthyaceae bacterium]